MKKLILNCLMVIIALTAITCLGLAEDEHHEEHNAHGENKSHEEDGEEAGHGQEELVTLSLEQCKMAGIKVDILNAKPITYSIYAPGELLANGYSSYLVSPRVDSVVLSRQVSLGDHVKKGKVLVTLFSAIVAEAQATFRIADSEWKRVKKLGKKALGAKRYVSAHADFEAAKSKLLAFGLSEKAISALNEDLKHLGEYTLTAHIDGTVLSDNFRQGQRVEAGQALIELADERELWVEARLAPNSKINISAGTKANVKILDEVFPAKVTQESHTIDEETRTRTVRLVVDNAAHRLHPGMYADVYFSFTTEKLVLAVPESSLMRGSDGDWLVFVEKEPGKFLPHEVELKRHLGKSREISGIASGSRIVMEGAFFVASEKAKSGFDPHDH